MRARRMRIRSVQKVGVYVRALGSRPGPQRSMYPYRNAYLQASRRMSGEHEASRRFPKMGQEYRKNRKTGSRALVYAFTPWAEISIEPSRSSALIQKGAKCLGED